jgi:hypothetical protein
MSNRFSLCVAACLVLFSLDPVPAFSGSGISDWDMSDLSGALELNAVERRDAMITVSLKNSSSGTITAVALSLKEDVHHYQDWMNAEPPGLAPGQTFDVTVGADEGADRKLRIAAVLFDDGGGKGDSSQLDIMNFHRFGQMLEGVRVRDLLRSSNSPNDDERLNALAQRIGKIPLSSEDAFLSLAGIDIPEIRVAALRQSGEKTRTAFFWGVSTARERALRQIEQVKQLPAASPDDKASSRETALAYLQDRYEEQHRKAAALLARMQGGR